MPKKIKGKKKINDIKLTKEVKNRNFFFLTKKESAKTNLTLF